MSNTVSLSREAFKRGVNETLTLKPLREAVVQYCQPSEKKRTCGTPKSSASGKHSVVMVRRGGNSVWHVKSAS